jgi:DNA recombination protein RmuC
MEPVMTVWIAIAALLVGTGTGAGGVYIWMMARAGAAAASGNARLNEIQTSGALALQRAAEAERLLSVEQQNSIKLRESLGIRERELASQAAQLEAARVNLMEQRKLLDDAQGQLRSAFATVSAEALAKNNEAFLGLARERFATLQAEATGSLDERKAQIDGLLKPMKQLIEQYQVRVGDIEKSRVESYSMLREQLGTLAETQRTLNTQTNQLVTALSRPMVRGQWGEISLRKLVELAGLSDRCDFVEQVQVDTEDGRLRPDVVVKLPGDRDVIIDCKACLDAFLDAAAAVDEDVRKDHLIRHAGQVRSRMRDLAAKSYWSQFPRSPEFVVMFLPGEAFLYAAVEHDSALIEDCLKNHVIVATPTTLIALLKAIEFGWRQESITENAEQIRSLGVELYERVAVALGYISKIGSGLTATVNSYNQAIGSLETRVLVTARKMGELGARSDKEFADLDQVEKVPREVSGALVGNVQT